MSGVADPFPSFTCGRGRKSGLVSLAQWTCARPRVELSKGHDSIIRELKSTASKSLVASLSESTGHNYKHRPSEIADIDTRKSESHKHATQHWHQNISAISTATSTGTFTAQARKSSVS